jgi:alpha-1,3-rhamnosyl/mannosyltransferase
MRVLVNGLASAGARTGIGHYTGELVRCLHEQTESGSIGVFPPAWLGAARRWWGCCRSWLSGSASSTSPSSPGTATSISWKGRAMTALRSVEQALLANRFQASCRRGRYDLYHEPNVIPLPSDLPTVTTIHDLSVLLHPEWHPADRVAQFEKRFADGIRRSQHILTVSEFSRQEIIDTLGLPPHRVSRTYNGIRPHLKPLAADAVREGLRSLGLPPRYLLCLGTLEPRKNVLMLMRAYCSLPGNLRECYPLVLVGGKGWNSADIHAFLDEQARHKGVIHRGYVADEHLVTVYNGARALLFPSWYEGFGLPPLEMMACGGAVVASTAGSVSEVVGRKAHLIDPADVDGWREAMLRVIADESWWHELRRDVTEVARPFTWDRCAAETIAVYQGVLERKITQPRAA